MIFVCGVGLRLPAAAPCSAAASFLAAALGGLATALVLAGCVPTRWPESGEPATSRTRVTGQQSPSTAPTKPGPGNPPFYEVFGERYFVLPDSEGYREEGVASWYGAPFHGRRTSSGAVYDMYGLTAAHKTLPLPSLVRVTNLKNGSSVVVTVNDRGPFVKGRIIDLSYAAAQKLGIVDLGTCEVEVEALGGRSGAEPTLIDAAGLEIAGAGTARATPTAPGSSPVAPVPVPIQSLFMQVGAFRDQPNALALQSRLRSNGVGDIVVRYDDTVSPPLYRVRIGPIEDSGRYDALAARVAAMSIPNPRLVMELPTAVDTSTRP